MARRTKEEAEKTRKRIMASALSLFAKRGYDRTTFNDIAARLGLTKGAQASTCAVPPATPWLSADRMCWAGNAAAFSRTRLGRRDDWRWTRPRRQSGDCRAGRGRSQAPSATGG